MNDIDLLLNAQIETLLDRVSISALKETVKRLSNTYQTNNIDRSNIVNDDTFALAYIAYRMPTTYQAIKKPLRELFNIDKNISTVLDIGSGPFTCYWALSCLVSNINITCLEKQTSMIKTGKSLLKDIDLPNQLNIIKDDINQFETSEKFDLVMCAYSLNELNNVEKNNLIGKLLTLSKKYILIIEPGTPDGFKSLIELKNIFTNECHLSVVAPCMYEHSCPLLGTDYCNFTVRVSRTKCQKYIKEGVSPFEDEKFFYLLLSKEQFSKQYPYRLIRHPQIKGNCIDVKLCSKEGVISKTIYKSSPCYKKIKKSSQGDLIDNV